MEPVDDDGVPVDIAAVRHDDALIEALASGGSVNTADNAEFELASLLADWRDEIVSAPLPAGPTVDEVLAAQATPDRAMARRRRFAVIAGAAAAVVALAGVSTVFVRGAEPGDRLWSAKEVMFAQAASQTLATSEAKAQIGSARTALDSGDTEAVSSALDEARQRAAVVKDAETKAQLERQIRALAERAGLPTPGASTTDAPTVTPSGPPTSSAKPTTPTSIDTTSVNPTIMIAPVPTGGHTTTEPTRTTTRTPTRTTEPTTTEPTTTRPTTTRPTTTTEPTTTPPASTTTTAPPSTTTTTPAR